VTLWLRVSGLQFTQAQFTAGIITFVGNAGVLLEAATKATNSPAVKIEHVM